MAHKKAAGSSNNGRDSNGQRLGIKAFGGEVVTAGSIIVRQRGLKYRPGKNVRVGKDDTLYTTVAGAVSYTESRFLRYDGRSYKRTVVNVGA